jgi:hypothetical protein
LLSTSDEPLMIACRMSSTGTGWEERKRFVDLLVDLGGGSTVADTCHSKPTFNLTALSLHKAVTSIFLFPRPTIQLDEASMSSHQALSILRSPNLSSAESPDSSNRNILR